MMLKEIIKQKKIEIERFREKIPLPALVKKASGSKRLRDFKAALVQTGRINLIGEIKKASPSKGLLRGKFDPAAIAREYQEAGACALSVLTDEKFFQGNLRYLKLVRDAVNLPILRKDFIIDRYQIYQSLLTGADALLLIARILSAAELKEFYSLCNQLGLDALCEVRSQKDLDKALGCGCQIIGINNRDLETFNEDLTLSSRLIKLIPKSMVIVSESAIRTKDDLRYLQQLGLHAVLIGEAFMRSADIKAKVKQLFAQD